MQDYRRILEKYREEPQGEIWDDLWLRFWILFIGGSGITIGILFIIILENRVVL